MQVAREIEMPLICELSDEKTIIQQSYAGIYRIDVCTTGANDLDTWIEEFRAEWEHVDFKKRFTPNFKKKRIAKHSVLVEWMPLYLGKSKNIGKRVTGHINLGLSKSTFALKLKARPGMVNRRLRLHALAVPVTNYDLIVGPLEKALRDHFHPLIGKQ